MTLNEAQKALARAVRGLAPEQGRIARKNARVRVKRAIKAITGAMDAEYPAIKKEVKRTPLPKTHAGKMRRRNARATELYDRGWRRLSSTNREQALIIELARANIQIKHIHGTDWCPGWAYTVGMRKPALLAAAKNMTRKQRKALLVEINLTNAEVPQ